MKIGINELLDLLIFRLGSVLLGFGVVTGILSNNNLDDVKASPLVMSFVAAFFVLGLGAGYSLVREIILMLVKPGDKEA